MALRHSRRPAQLARRDAAGSCSAPPGVCAAPISIPTAGVWSVWVKGQLMRALRRRRSTATSSPRSPASWTETRWWWAAPLRSRCAWRPAPTARTHARGLEPRARRRRSGGAERRAAHPRRGEPGGASLRDGSRRALAEAVRRARYSGRSCRAPSGRDRRLAAMSAAVAPDEDQILLGECLELLPALPERLLLADLPRPAVQHRAPSGAPDAAGGRGSRGHPHGLRRAHLPHRAARPARATATSSTTTSASSPRAWKRRGGC